MYLLVEWISLVGLKLNLKILKVERFKNNFSYFQSCNTMAHTSRYLHNVLDKILNSVR